MSESVSEVQIRVRVTYKLGLTFRVGAHLGSGFIPTSLHFSGHFIPKGKIVTSNQSLHTSHFIPKLLHIRALHTDIGKVNKI